MMLSTYIWESQNEIERIIVKGTRRLIKKPGDAAAILVDAFGELEQVRTDILDLLNRIDVTTLKKEVGNPDGKIHERDD